MNSIVRSLAGMILGVLFEVTSLPAVTLPALPPPVTDTVPTHDATTGTMMGSASTDGGAAIYAIPVVVPPGRAGMQPALSLNYNSRSGNGSMGVGWTLSGLSSVHRCPQTPEQDGKTLGVSYTSNDRLCLDGQRLVSVSGIYGAANTVYHTEIDSYARIIQVGSGLTGSATCFRVEQKDGRIFHYGAVTTGTSPSGLSCATSTANSRVLPGSAAGTLSWLVEKIEDRVGNNQLYAYQAFGNGENLLRTVTYTGSTAGPGDRTVTLTYESRATAASGAQDVTASYLAGALTMQTQALAKITTAVAGTTVRTYTPAYYASQYSGRLFMTDVTECAASAGTTSCHPKTHFVFNDDAINTQGNFPFTSLASLNLPNLTSDQSAQTPLVLHTIGDLDGDGTRESAVVLGTSTGQHVYLVQMTADRVEQAAVDLTGTDFSFDATSYVDIDGDGRAKLMKIPASGNLTFGVWKLGRGTAVTSSATYSTLFTDYSSNIPTAAGDLFYSGDFNGDGKMDIVRVAFQRSEVSGTSCTGSQKPVLIYFNAMTGTLGSSGNTTATFTAPTKEVFCLNVTASGGTVTAQSIDHIADFNGDGLPDFYIRSDTTSSTAASSSAFVGVEMMQAKGTVTLAACGTTMGLTDCNISPNFVTWMDVNGDGLDDLVIARPTQSGGPTWRVSLNKGNGTFGAEIDTGSNYGLDVIPARGPTAPATFRYTGRMPNVDVDSDGRPDILVPAADLHSSAFALKMCTVQTFYASTGDTTCPGTNATNSAITTSAALQCAAYACPEDPGTSTLNMPPNGSTGNQGFPALWKNLPAYGAYTGNSYLGTGVDNSLYHVAMLKFVQTDSTHIQVVANHTPLLGRLSNANETTGNSDDLFGDGLADLMTVVGCSNNVIAVTNGSSTVNYHQCSTVAQSPYGPTQNLPDGTAVCTTQTDGSCYFDSNPVLYANANQGVVAYGGTPAALLAQRSGSVPTALKLAVAATNGTSLGLNPVILPGLLDQAANGVGDTADWAYAPLSMPGSQDSIPFYSVPSTGGYVDSRHYYFQSSMPAVSGMTQSTGTGDLYGFRSFIYGYGQAMYNHLGRGFTGFQTIVSEIAATDATRRVRTTTTFNQKFPLIGKVTSISQMYPNNGKTFRTESDSYICTLSNRAACPADTAIAAAATTGGTVFAPVLDTQTVKDFDLGTGTQYDEVDTVNSNGSASGWDAYGNLAHQTVTRSDKGSSIFVSSHTTTAINTFDTSDTADWWVNKLTNSSVASTVTYSSTHALPSGASAPSQTVATAYTYNADRTLATRTIQSGITNQQSTIAFTYPSPSYGLPTQTLLCLGSYSAGTCTGDIATGLSPSRTTGFTYTKDGSSTAADGYFVLTTTNALSQTTTTTHQASDGQVLTATDPNGIQVVTSYDPFGRATQIQHLGNTGAAFESPMKIAYTKCASASCPGGYGESTTYEANAAYRITTVQAGYPTKVAWYDLLGREIKTAERGYTGTFIDTVTLYDDLGTVSEKFTPFYASGSATYFTSWTYDTMNRPLVKVSSANDMDPTHGNFTTGYTYSGRTTSITAHGSLVTCPGTSNNLCITMSRSKNVLGQYMQTTDAKSGVTNYWTEPLGHVVATQDAELNVIRATYNALGQRTQSADPDQGTWNFTYDALGELLSQTDARGVVTNVLLRDAVGRVKRQEEVPPATPPAGLDNEYVLDIWSYDGPNGIGEPYASTRRRGTSSGNNSAVWAVTYGYEAATARLSTRSTTITEGSAVALNSSMTYDSNGRPSTHTYPSGLVVQTEYAAYGHPGAIANATTGQIYWEAMAMDAWNKVTAESYMDGTTGVIANYQSTGQQHTASWSLSSSVVDSLTYSYDSFGNLVSQKRTAGASTNTETYGYDALQRLTSTSRTGGSVSYGYTASGNLQYKSDYSSSATTAYSYAAANSHSSGCGPHAAYSVALAPSGTDTYSCDANGNVIGGALTATYDAENHTRTANRTGATVTWAYDTSGQMDYESSPSRGTRYFTANGYEQVGTQMIHELGPIIVTRVGTTDTITTSLRDRLGSTIDTIDGGAQNAANTRANDAFGAARNGDMSLRTNGTLNLADTIHGYTQHEHADDVWLIHMGGRVFDYRLGRFLSVDPIIGNPLSSQSLNPYSYIGNNPLGGTDPTGYATCAASEAASTSECGQVGVHTIVADDGGKTTLIVGNQGDQVRLTDTTTHMSNSYTIGNGAQKLDFRDILSMNVSADKIQSLTSKDLGPAKTAAMLSKCTYGSCALPADVMPTDLGFNEQRHINPGLYDDAGAQFHAESFVSDDGAGAYLTFRGTRPSNLQDWVTNVGQGAGLKTRAYQDAFNLGQAFSKGVEDSVNKLYAGHSLGGGLASLAGVTSGERTITFNSAGLSSGTLARYGASRGSANGLVSAYYLRGEILSVLQDHSPLPKAVGTRIPINPISSTPWSPVARHGIDSVLDAMGGSQ